MSVGLHKPRAVESQSRERISPWEHWEQTWSWESEPQVTLSAGCPLQRSSASTQPVQRQSLLRGLPGHHSYLFPPPSTRLIKYTLHLLVYLFIYWCLGLNPGLTQPVKVSCSPACACLSIHFACLSTVSSWTAMNMPFTRVSQASGTALCKRNIK